MKKGKKSIILAIGIIVLGVLAFLATNLVRNSEKSDSELLEFSIADTSIVDQIQIKDAYNNEFQLVKGADGVWTDSDGNCVIQEPVNTMLETFKNIEFKGYVPENSKKNVTNRIAATNTEVKIFQNGKWVKTWYVGNATQDHYGTYMLLETNREKSDYPVIMKVRGLSGIIEPRFFADKRKWRCTEIFAVPREEIASVNVNYTKEKEKSFSVERKGYEYIVKHNGELLAGIDTSMAVRYLNAYKKVHFELVNYEYTDKQVDSVKRSKPFCELTLKKTNGQSEKLRMFRMAGQGEEIEDDYGNPVSYDINRFWCELPTGELVKAQYFVFNPLIMGHLYFGHGKPVTKK
ncbi:MAG: hypothetical protein PHQ74_11175 [Crocinitomicaceae bacterium]|nr:hypothetical protein [Crocinitomicaceae bacterium]